MLREGLLCVNVLDDGRERVDWMCVLGVGVERKGWVEQEGGRCVNFVIELRRKLYICIISASIWPFPNDDT